MNTTCTEMVREFHKLNGNAIAAEPTMKLAALRTRCIAEELVETYIALQENNVIEAADGLTDLLYVIAGTAVSYNTKFSDCFVVTRVPPVDSFEPAVVVRFGARMFPLLQSAAAALSTSTANNLRSALQATAAAISAAAVLWGFPLQELFSEVHRSNMTKTFAPNDGKKYGAANPKGPRYSPPDIAGILAKARSKFNVS
jgi:predicted HAD superfamily Cof-like phosphohydrolase